ncbi:APC family permease [Pectinatus brassicae]|uniref:Amino acid transporter n=1 Tax=Pectinatus brassicae TaxID=862415 RepID=A0A840UMT2_9FIRM|nr:APC family permease [Pectinatus brassicae]MBB5337127.1 amino acid transporter [Pectinatus brassicae]
MISFLKRLLIGRPLQNQEISNEKLSKCKALAIFSSDALSSVAYGPEQIMLILAIPGMFTYGYISYIAAVILLLLGIVTVSYIQIGRANPGGGGSYAVAKNNLGEMPSLVAAAALIADYTLTVAVSVSAGTTAIVAAVPALLPYEVNIDIFVLFIILMIINLRGIREASNTFVYPTYAFVVGIITLIIVGTVNAFTQPAPIVPPESLEHQFNWTIVFLLLRSFANGCSSMTGIEAISNGIPMFKEPSVKNASTTALWMSGLLGFMLVGITFLIMHFHVLPLENNTALSYIAEKIFGHGFFYYYIQFTTMLILYLAANTSFNGLPQLMSILASDGYLPRYLSQRGERLSFSNGIILLSIAAGLLIFFYQGNTEHLISLYAIGVFISFTIAQVSMVHHWRTVKGPLWILRTGINTFGAIITSIVVLVIAISKFAYGAWIILLFIPFMIFIFKKIKEHYNDMAEQLHLPLEKMQPDIDSTIIGKKHIVLVPISSPTNIIAHTLSYAKSISNDVRAIHIAINEEIGQKVSDKWQVWNPGVPLITIQSPYRLVITPLIDYIDNLIKEEGDNNYITVLIPEFKTYKWWHRLLHNQTGIILMTLLILKRNVIVTTVPFHLKK